MLNNKNPLKHFFILIGLIAINTAAYAENPKISPAQVLGVVTHDWNDDGAFDRAVLALSTADDSEAELFIYLSDATNNRMQLALHKKNIAWVGGLWGALPSITTNGRGSLIVNVANDSIGRNRWSQKLTIAYRKQVFMVAGYTYMARDTLNPDYQLDCDVNLLTGRGIKNAKLFQSSTKAMLLSGWSDAAIHKDCQ